MSSSRSRQRALRDISRYATIFRYLEAARLLRDRDSRVRSEALKMVKKIAETDDEEFIKMMLNDLTPHAWHFTDDPKTLDFLRELAGMLKRSNSDAKQLKTSLKLIDKYNRDRGAGD